MSYNKLLSLLKSSKYQLRIDDEVDNSIHFELYKDGAKIGESQIQNIEVPEIDLELGIPPVSFYLSSSSGRQFERILPKLKVDLDFVADTSDELKVVTYSLFGKTAFRKLESARKHKFLVIGKMFRPSMLSIFLQRTEGPFVGEGSGPKT
ncbi:MAG: hypothetical protein ABWY71_00260 [Candidatus Saccharimonadales bacterium]